jgi:hypothetical protein
MIDVYDEEAKFWMNYYRNQLNRDKGTSFEGERIWHNFTAVTASKSFTDLCKLLAWMNDCSEREVRSNLGRKSSRFNIVYNILH